MEISSTSLLIAKIAGIIYGAVGLGFLINGDYYQKIINDFISNAGATYLAGIFTTVLGYLMVTYHSIWKGPVWVIVISVLGWSALIKGLSLLIAPELMIKISQKINRSKLIPWYGLIVLALGAYLGYYGFAL